MFKSLALTSSLAAGLAMIGALVLAPQEASAGRFGGGFHASAPHFAVARPAFHPAFRPAFHAAFRPAFHVAPRRTFGGYRPTHSAGLVRHERGGYVHERSRTHLGRLDHERGGRFHLPHGRIAPAFYAPDDAAPDAPVVDPVVATPDAGAPLSGPDANGPVSNAGKSVVPPVAATCAPGGSSVAVSFAPKATATDISNFLKAYGVTIVDGPNADGRYRVRLSDKLMPPNEVMQAVQSMQTQTAIVSAVTVF